MKCHFLVFLSIITAYSISANDDFSSLLDEMTEIATKTKLNIDYQPSVVSVVKAKKLKNIGITNLHEALGLLPGIETSILHTGWKQVIIRGNYSPDTFVFDKYKLYIDGVDVGSDLYSTSYFYLDFPIELIDRIEVLRGSASSVYGPGAFSGAINVITRNSQVDSKNSFFATIGSYEYVKSGFTQNYKTNSWTIGLDGYYQTNNKTMYAGPSFVFDPNYARDDYNSLENFKDFSLGLTAQNDYFKIITRYKSETTDNFYGSSEELEPVIGGYQRNKSLVFELQNLTRVNSNISLESKLGLNYYEFKFDTEIFKDFIRIAPIYKQVNTYIDVNLKGKNFNNNDWILGVNLKKIDTIENKLESFYPSITADKFLDADHDQILKSIYFQNIYSINENLDISANLRLDDYSIFDEMLSYRVASVYRLDDNNIFKAIYGRSYRAPSYIEAFQELIPGFKRGNPNLKSEYIDTYELSYTYKNNNLILRTNGYYSVMQDVIDILLNEPNSFEGDYYNHKDRKAKGLEVEFTYIFENGIEFMSNLSYVRTKYFTPDYYNPVEYTSPEISEVLSKGYLLYPLTKQLNLNTAWYYSGSKNGFDPGNKGNSQAFDSTFVVDQTILYKIDESSNVSFSVKNLFDETIKYPSYTQNHESITREGRNWLLSYSKQF